MKPIETLYAGHRFRSRLEARWAVFFDALKLEWQYELQGFKLPSGRQYLPDFYLPTLRLRERAKPGVWIEVKSVYPSGDELSRIQEFGSVDNSSAETNWQGPNFVMLCGTPAVMSNGLGHYQMGPWWDHGMAFMRCYGCKQIKIDYRDLANDECSCGGHTWHDHTTLMAAEHAARGARFEHGECGAR